MHKIAILGAGKSGVGAALLAQDKGLQVFVSDANRIAAPHKKALIAHHIPFEEKQHTADKILSADEVVKSPGIPDSTPIIQAIQKKSIPIIAEIELASRYTHAFLIGITGTNGKTTTAYLITHLLKVAGLNVAIAGNVGTSLSRRVLENKYDYYVLELSSFQLEGMYHCKMDIACLLNITPDHLDRYQGQMAAYIQAKFRVLQNMTTKTHFVYNQTDDNIKAYLQQHAILPRQHPVSIQQDHKDIGNFYSSLTNLRGEHNWFNALVAIKVAQLLSIDKTRIKRGLSTFTGVPHRIEWVANIGGISFYNDSKATNVAATYAALMSFAQPIIWIAGGKDKGNDYTALQDLVRTHVKAMICLGKDNSRIQRAFQQIVKPIYITTTMKEAVAIALSLAQPEDVVLFSPACASFDLFKNFEERGDCFKQTVLQVKNTRIAIAHHPHERNRLSNETIHQSVAEEQSKG